MATSAVPLGPIPVVSYTDNMPRPREMNDPLALESAMPSPSSNDDQEQDETPNWPSGWRPWCALVGCFFLMFNSWGLVNAYGTFQSYYNQHLLRNSDTLQLNLIGSSQCFFVLALSAAQGRLLDAGHARMLLGIGAVCVTAGLFGLSAANPGQNILGGGSYGLTYLTQGVIVSIGMSFFFLASSQIAATWFPKRKTVIVGIVACGASVAGLVYPFTTKELLYRIGFNNAVRVDAGIATATCLYAWLFATPNPDYPIRKPRRWLSLEAWNDPHAWANPAFCWFVAAIALMFFGFYAIFFNLEQWAASKGLGRRDAVPGAVAEVTTPLPEVHKDAIRTFYLLSIMNVCSSIGRLAGGFYGQTHGTLLVHGMVMFIASALCLVLWPLTNTPGVAMAFVVLFGVFSGAVIGLPPASVFSIADLDPKADKSRLGQWTGMMYTCSAAFALTGPVIAGYIVQKTGSYLGLQMFSGGCLLAASACIFLSYIYTKHGSVATAMDIYKAAGSNLASRVTVATRSKSVANTPYSTSAVSSVTAVNEMRQVRWGASQDSVR